MEDITQRPQGSQLEWEYRPQEQPKKEWGIRDVLRDIFIFIFYIIVGFGIVFLPTLFYVGEFLDPLPSTLKAVKVAGIVLGGEVVFSCFAFWKGKSVTASGLLIGGALALTLFGVGYYYYLNGQILPLFESILSFFSL